MGDLSHVAAMRKLATDAQKDAGVADVGMIVQSPMGHRKEVRVPADVFLRILTAAEKRNKEKP